MRMDVQDDCPSSAQSLQTRPGTPIRAPACPSECYPVLRPLNQFNRGLIDVRISSSLQEKVLSASCLVRAIDGMMFVVFSRTLGLRSAKTYQR